jgi:hypothetical protein
MGLKMLILCYLYVGQWNIVYSVGHLIKYIKINTK